MINYSDTADVNKKLITIRVQRISEESVEKLERAISDAHQYKQSVLPIVIDSTGGCAYCAIAMSEMIKSSDIKIATIVESRAMSSGALLFSCGHFGFRYIGKNAIVMLHDVKTSNTGKVEEIKSDAKESERLNNVMYELMAQNCGHENSFFKKMVHDNSHADLYLNAEDCIKCNMANHIKVPKFKSVIKVEYELF